MLMVIIWEAATFYLTMILLNGKSLPILYAFVLQYVYRMLILRLPDSTSRRLWEIREPIRLWRPTLIMHSLPGREVLHIRSHGNLMKKHVTITALLTI